MRVLLAGGAGFIGSHLSDALVARGDQVVIVDNFVTSRESNIAHLLSAGTAHFVLHDVCQPLPAHDALAGRFDAVLNFASPASPSDFGRIPLEILEVGSSGTKNLLDRAHTDGARFMQASTSEVYGDPLVHPQAEDYWGNVSPIGPRSCYDESKRFAEALVMAYHRVHGLDVRIVRIFNTYGERTRPNDGRVASTFITQALRNESITVHAGGAQSRSFCYIADEVRGLLALLDSDCNGIPINIGSPDEVTMRHLAELVIELTGSTSTIVDVPMPSEREGDPRQRTADISRARALLGWEPKVALRDGLTRMIAYFEEHENLTNFTRSP